MIFLKMVFARAVGLIVLVNLSFSDWRRRMEGIHWFLYEVVLFTFYGEFLVELPGDYLVGAGGRLSQGFFQFPDS